MGQNCDKNGTKLRQKWDKIGTKMGQIWDEIYRFLCYTGSIAPPGKETPKNLTQPTPEWRSAVKLSH